MIVDTLTAGDRVTITAGKHKNTRTPAIIRSTTRCYVSVEFEQGGKVVTVRKTSVEKTTVAELSHKVQELKNSLAVAENRVNALKTSIAIAEEQLLAAPEWDMPATTGADAEPHVERDPIIPARTHTGPLNDDSWVAGDRVRIRRDRAAPYGRRSRIATELEGAVGTVDRASKCFVWVKVDGRSGLAKKANSNVSRRLQEHAV
jgi:hypothetical protein